jgi:hypothetical protein
VSGPTGSARDDWEARIAALWASFEDFDRDAFVAKVEALAGERPHGDAIAHFELASAYDSTGYEEKAEPNYRAALAAGLTGVRRRRAVIQLASTLRNLGQISEAIALLSAEREAESDELDDAVDATLALALADAGEAKRGLSLVLTALARHLPRYNRSMANYAKELLNDA